MVLSRECCFLEFYITSYNVYIIIPIYVVIFDMNCFVHRGDVDEHVFGATYLFLPDPVLIG